MTKEITELLEYLRHKGGGTTSYGTLEKWATAVEQLQENLENLRTEYVRIGTKVEAYERILDKGIQVNVINAAKDCGLREQECINAGYCKGHALGSNVYQDKPKKVCVNCYKHHTPEWHSEESDTYQPVCGEHNLRGCPVCFTSESEDKVEKPSKPYPCGFSSCSQIHISPEEAQAHHDKLRDAGEHPWDSNRGKS